MCCCDKPTVNGEPGCKMTFESSPGTHPVNPPTLQDGDVLLFDAPGRCGGLDSHSHHFRVVKRGCGSVSLLIRHGGGDERFRLYPHRDLPKILETLDSTARYCLLATIHSAYRDGKTYGQDRERGTWMQAAIDKRIKTRKLPSRGIFEVWIEPDVATQPTK